MHWIRRRVSVVYFFGLLLLLSPGLLNGAMPADESVREAVAARFEALQQLEVEYDVVHRFTPHGIDPGYAPSAASVGISVKTGTERFSRRFSFLHGRARWESKKSKETVDAETPRRIPLLQTYHTYFNGSVEQMDVFANQPNGCVEARRLPPKVCFADLALGFRDGYAGGWMTTDTLGAMELSRNADGHVILHRFDRKMRLEWVFDPNRGYALIAHRRYDYLEPHGLGEEAIASDFRLVNGVLLPFALMHRDLYRDGKESNRWEATVTKYVLNGPDNTPDYYHVPWRKGMTVMDRRTGNVFKIMRDGQILTSETLSQATRAPVPGAQPTTAADSSPQLVRWVAQSATSAAAGDGERWRFPYLLIMLLLVPGLAGLVWSMMRRRRHGHS